MTEMVCEHLSSARYLSQVPTASDVVTPSQNHGICSKVWKYAARFKLVYKSVQAFRYPGKLLFQLFHITFFRDCEFATRIANWSWDRARRSDGDPKLLINRNDSTINVRGSGQNTRLSDVSPGRHLKKS